MKAVEGYPFGKNFVAVWTVGDDLFCASFHFQNDQYYSYDQTADQFIEECDHGYSPATFRRLNATFFVIE